MTKQGAWCDGAVLSLRLRDGLFSLAQMRAGYLMQFFNVRGTSDAWSGIDLNTVPSLGMRFVAERNMKSLFGGRHGPDAVVPNVLPIERRMLHHFVRADGTFGAHLIELTPDLQVIDAAVLQEDLDIEHDLALIYRFEMCGMLGDADKLQRRLVRFFDTGVNWDEAKGVIYKNIPLPPPHWQPPSSNISRSDT